MSIFSSIEIYHIYICHPAESNLFRTPNSCLLIMHEFLLSFHFRHNTYHDRPNSDQTCDTVDWVFFLIISLGIAFSQTHKHSLDHFSIDSPLTLIKCKYIQRTQGVPASMAHPETRNGCGWWCRIVGRTSIPSCCESKLRYSGMAAFPNTMPNAELPGAPTVAKHPVVYT